MKRSERFPRLFQVETWLYAVASSCAIKRSRVETWRRGSSQTGATFRHGRRVIWINTCGGSRSREWPVQTAWHGIFKPQTLLCGSNYLNAGILRLRMGPVNGQVLRYFTGLHYATPLCHPLFSTFISEIVHRDEEREGEGASLQKFGIQLARSCSMDVLLERVGKRCKSIEKT